MNSFRFTIWLVALSMLLSLSACSGGGSSSDSNKPQLGGAIQGTPLSLSGSVSTLAGPLPALMDGTGTAARFNYPYGITTDGANLYVADASNHSIRKVVIATGEVTTLAGSLGKPGATDGMGAGARFNYPHAITTDGTNLFVADTSNSTIRKVVIATGEVTTLAGSAGSCGPTDGTGTAASFCRPTGITTDGVNIFVADGTRTIRKVVIATSEVTTLAGDAGSQSAADGTGTGGTFSHLTGITTDGTNLFVTDDSAVRKVVIATGEVTTLAGKLGSCGSADGIGTTASFCRPIGITTDGTNLFIADSDNRAIRKVVIVTGEVTTLASYAEGSGSADGTGNAGSFSYPSGITTDGANLFVTELNNETILKVAIATGVVATMAGKPRIGSTDGTRGTAEFSNPRGITTDGTHLFVADSGNSTIRKVVIATGEVTTLAGSAGSWGSMDGTGTAARFSYPTGITTDRKNLFVADSGNNTIRKVVIATGEVTTLAGNPGSSGSADGTGTAARFSCASGITTDGTNLFVADTSNCTIRKVVIATGQVTTLAGSAGSPGSTDGPGTLARFNIPTGITTDGMNLFVADTNNGTIRKVVIATGEVTTLAGSAESLSSTDGPGTLARFTFPTGITTDGTNLYVTESLTVRKVRIPLGVSVTTLAGSFENWGFADGTGAEASFQGLSGITTDGSSLFVTDQNCAIRRID